MQSPTAKEISCRVTRSLLLYLRKHNVGSLGNLLEGINLNKLMPNNLLHVLSRQVLKIRPDTATLGALGGLRRVRWDGRKRRFLSRRAARKAIENLREANRRIEDKYEEARRLASELEATNRQLLEAKQRLESNAAKIGTSEEHYRFLAENVSDIIWTFDLETMRFTYISPSVQRIRGFTPEEAMGLSLEKTIDHESFERVMKLVSEEQTERGEPGIDPNRDRTVEVQHFCKDGSYAWAEVTMSFIRNRQGAPAGLVGVARDISERNRMQEALKDSEELFHRLFDTLPLGVGLIDPETLRYVLFNEAMARDLGFTTAEFAKLTLADIEAVHDRETIAANHSRMITGERMQFETKLRHKSSGERDVLVTASAINMRARRLILSIVADITDRKRMEEEIIGSRNQLELRVKERTVELEASHERFRTLVELLPEMVFEVDARGYHTYANRQALETFRLTLQDFERGLHIREVVAEKDYSRIMENVTKILKGEALKGGEYTVRRKDGSEFPAFIRASPIENKGLVIGIRGIVVDLTDYRKAEVERIRLENQLRQSQKMEALGTMAGGVAHDFNNILAAVIGFSEMTLDELPDHSPYRYNLERVFNAGLRGRDLVKQMLAFSRKNDLQRKPVRPSTVIDDTIKLLRASIPTTVSIDVETGGGAGFVLADSTQLQQVIINLCNNASDAMHENGGTLTIRLSEPVITDSRMIDGLSPGPYVKLSVKDTGKGMEQHVLERIFEPFFTTKDPGRGTGLGLSVAHGIVTGYGGTISVDSKLGHGTRFEVFLPKIEEQDVQNSEDDESTPGGKERILLVDDDESLVDMAKNMMETLGYRVTATTNSVETLDIFRKDPGAFDVIISDQTMPGMTGLQLSAELKSIRDIPIILCSGFSQAIDADPARAAGIEAFVMKPLTKNELSKTIRKVVGKARD